MKRRTLIKAGLSVPVGLGLMGCAPAKDLSKMTSSYAEGMYLSGNFAPVTEEQTLTELNVTGKIPEELIGRFLETATKYVAIACDGKIPKIVPAYEGFTITLGEE